MSQLLANILSTYSELLYWLCAFFVGFGLLTRFMPCNAGQRWYRKDMLTDILYFFIMPLLTRFVYIGFLSTGMSLLFYNLDHETIGTYMKNGFGPLGTLQLWLQAALVFIISDIMLYWTHRTFHGRRLWRFHAIHHSAREVDWLTTYRFHPVNTWLSFTLVDTLMLLVGFSPEAVSMMAAFNMIYSAMVHANLNWTFGPFRYVFASPVFHRWHHTAQEEGMNKNFAPTFPLLDLMFGTFYMPDGVRPQHYGVPGAGIPDSFIGQMVWPFKKH